ncbi:MAG: PIN domain-containing protein [Acidimicrobiia bacterium]
MSRPVLVDTSMWIDHLRGEGGLEDLLHDGAVLTHPFVVGELACGSLAERAEVLGLLSRLPAVEVVSHDEVMTTVETHRLWGGGLGWVDAHLLAAALLAGCPLLTRDRPLRDAAGRLGLPVVS